MRTPDPFETAQSWAAWRGPTIVGGLNALDAGLFSIGIPKNNVLAYKAAIRAGKFALIAHGTPEDVARAKDILKNTEADAIDYNEPVDQLEPVV